MCERSNPSIASLLRFAVPPGCLSSQRVVACSCREVDGRQERGKVTATRTVLDDQPIVISHPLLSTMGLQIARPSPFLLVQAVQEASGREGFREATEACVRKRGCFIGDTQVARGSSLDYLNLHYSSV